MIFVSYITFWAGGQRDFVTALGAVACEGHDFVAPPLTETTVLEYLAMA